MENSEQKKSDFMKLIDAVDQAGYEVSDIHEVMYGKHEMAAGLTGKTGDIQIVCRRYKTEKKIN